MDEHAECIATIDQLSAKRSELERAVLAILREPYGCAFCDSGKLRNPEKQHDAKCGFWMAACAVHFVQ